MKSFFISISLLFLVLTGQSWAGDVKIPVEQCHLWAMNAATIVQHRNEPGPSGHKMSEKDLVAYFNKLVTEQGGNVKSSEAEAVRELIRRIYRHKAITVAEAYDRTMRECVVNEGVILRQGQARTESRAGS